MFSKYRTEGWSGHGAGRNKNSAPEGAMFQRFSWGKKEPTRSDVACAPLDLEPIGMLLPKKVIRVLWIERNGIRYCVMT